MPTRCQIRKSPFPHLHTRTTGEIKPGDYFQALKAVIREEAFDPRLPEVTELGPTAELDINGVDLQKAEEEGAFIEEVWGGAQRHVAIAGGPPDARSFLAMAQEIFDDGPQCRTFETTAEALQWLSAQGYGSSPRGGPSSRSGGASSSSSSLPSSSFPTGAFPVSD